MTNIVGPYKIGEWLSRKLYKITNGLFYSYYRSRQIWLTLLLQIDLQ